jgi:hypothetical protein
MDPSYPPGAVEEFLIDHHRDEIRADILQVGHHGSKTSSRRSFLEAVHPSLAPVLRTDERDASCPLTRRIGPDTGPGGAAKRPPNKGERIQ